MIQKTYRQSKSKAIQLKMMLSAPMLTVIEFCGFVIVLTFLINR